MNMQIQHYTYDNKLLEEYANLNIFLSTYQANTKRFDRSHEARDTSLVKIKQSYPNIKLLVDTQSEKFPQKLMKILLRSDWSDIISWTPSGEAFRIYDKKRLMQVLTPQFYLEVTKFENFRRKLYSWGFRIMPAGEDCGAWYHPCFIRDKPKLCSKITRTNSSKSSKGVCSNGSGKQQSPSTKENKISPAYISRTPSPSNDTNTFPSRCTQRNSKMALKKKIKCRRDAEEREPSISKRDALMRENKGNNEPVLSAVDTLLNLGRIYTTVRFAH